ncbi:DUF11 domain-containing protein, partial [Candidatus Woesearchaeota archaeon]
DPVVKGQQLNYTIFINNTGDDTAFNVTVVEGYPLGVGLHAVQPSPSSGNNTFTAGNLSPGESFTINITVNVSSALTNGTVLNNSVSATFANVSGNSALVSDFELTTVIGFPVISAEKSDSPDPVVQGQTLSYAIRVNNTGDEVAYNVTVLEIYPVNVTFNGSSTVPSSGNNTFSLGNIAAGGFAMLNITVNVSSAMTSGLLNNTVFVNASNFSGVNQTVSISEFTEVIEGGQNVSNVTVTKFDSPDPVVRGSQLEYSIVLNSTGNTSAFNVTVVESYPPNVTFHNSSPAPVSGNDTFFIGDIANGSVLTLNITVNVSPFIPDGTVLNNSVVVAFNNTKGENRSASDSELTTVVAEQVAPNVTFISPANQSDFLLNETVNITVNVTDDTGVDTVLIEVTYPNGTMVNFTADVAGSFYNLTFLDLTQRGNYTVRVFANDTLDNRNDSVFVVFTRRPFNIIDVLNTTNNFVPYTVDVLANASGLLDLQLNFTGGRVQQLNVTVHPEISPYSIIYIDDEVPLNQTPPGSFAHYAIDLSFINVTNGTAMVTAIGNELLYVCKDYNFSGRECFGDWVANRSISPGTNYTVFLTPEDPGFLETSAAVDVAVAPINFTSFVVAFIDDAESDASFRIMNTNGSIIVNTTDVDTTVDNTSRIDVMMLNASHFVIAWVDGIDDDVRMQVFLINGTNVTSPADVDTNVGLNSDLGLAEIGDRFAVCYANDNDGDADFQTFFNNGTQAVGELNVDGAINPSATLQNLVDCSGVNSSRWVYFYFDDGTNDATFAIVNETGASQVGQVDVDTNVGETGQVAVATLANDTFGMVYYDSADQDVTIEIRYINNTVRLASTDIDTDAGVISRVAAGTVRRNETSGEDTFVVAWWDNASNDIKAAVYAQDGVEITAPFTVEAQPNQTFRLLDVQGRSPITGTEICPGRFVVAYTNGSGAGVFRGFFTNGTEWDGSCDLENPQVFDVRPFAGAIYNISDTIEIAANVTDDVGVDTVLANITFPNGTVQTLVLVLVPGTNKYNASFTIPITGLYNVSFFANDTSGKQNNSVVTNFTAVLVFPAISAFKTGSPDPVPKGTQLGYQVIINNSGNGTAYNITVEESYPSGVLFDASEPAPVLGNNTFSIGDLLPNSTFLLNITVNVSSAIVNGTVLNNSFNVTFANATGGNTTLGNSTLTTVLGAPVILNIKSDSPDPVVKGQQLNYTIFINNTGDDTAFNVTLSEFYPAGVVFDGSTPLPSVGNGTFLLGNLSPNESVTVNITVNVSVFVPNGTVLTNAVNASFVNSSGVNGSVVDSEATVVRGFANVQVRKFDDPDPVLKGQQLFYRLVVNNTGDEIAYNVTVVDSYPENVTFDASAPAPSSGNDTFSIGNLLPSEAFVINITVNVSANATNGTMLNNSFNATFANASGVNLTLANSTATTVLGAAVLVVVKSDSPDPVVKGQLLNYTILVNNSGDDGAFNLTVVDGYPLEVEFVSASPAPSSGNDTFALGNLSPNATATVNITVRVGRFTANGTVLSNTANASFQSAGGINGTASDTELTAVLGFPEVTTFKTGIPSPVLINTTLRYQITVNNSGDEIAYNVTVVEQYPANVTFNGSDPAPVGGNNTFVIPVLGPNSTGTVNITVNVSFFAGNGSILNNSYNLTFANSSGVNLTVENSTATLVSGVALLAVEKSDSVDPIVRGNLLNYTITVVNYDDEIAYNVTLVDSYPPNVSFVSASPAPSFGNGTFALGALAGGQSQIVSIQVRIGALLPNGTVLNNSASVTFANATGQNASVAAGEETTVLGDEFPVVSLVAPQNGTNTTNTTVLFYYNVTDDVSDVLSCSLDLNGSVVATNGSVLNGTASNFSASGLSQGNRTWAVRCTDGSNNTNTSETRQFTVDFTPPNFISLTFTPDGADALDPNTTILLTAGVTDNFTAVDTVVLRVLYNLSGYINITMVYNSSSGLFEANFTPNASGNFSFFLTANDTLGNNDTSVALNRTIEFESTWARVPASFGATAAPIGQNVSVGTLIVNNTGDFSLSFTLNSTFENMTFNVTNFTLAQGEVVFIEVNATAPNAFGQFPYNITINASGNATPQFNITTGTIVVSEDAFLFASFTILPAQVTRGQTGVTIEATVTNIGNQNASNVTLNITLPPDWVVTGGSLSGSFAEIEPNASESIVIIVEIPAGAVLGFRDVIAAADGFNDSGVQLSSINQTLGTTSQVEVVAASSFGPGGGGGGGAGAGAGAGAAAGGGGGAPGAAFPRTNRERPVLVTNATLEVLRGSRIVFPLEVFNWYNKSMMERVDLEVEGVLQRYVSWSPPFLENIPYAQSKVFEVEIASPLYQDKAELNVTFIITSRLVGEVLDLQAGVSRPASEMIVEYKTMRLLIREVTIEEIEELATDVERLYALVVAREYPTKRADALRLLLSERLAVRDFEEAAYLSQKLLLLLERELEAGTAIERLKAHIRRAESDGLDVRETQNVLALAVKAFEREDFDRALALADEALTIGLIERERAFSLRVFIVRYWWALLISAAVLAVAGRKGYRRGKVRYIAFRLDNMLHERIEVHRLLREAQERYFQKKEIGAAEFNRSMRGLQGRLERIVAQSAMLRLQRAHLTSVRAELEATQNEREKAVKGLKDAQDAYFVKRMISQRRYELRVEVLKVLITELDNELVMLKKRVRK